MHGTEKTGELLKRLQTRLISRKEPLHQKTEALLGTYGRKVERWLHSVGSRETPHCHKGCGQCCDMLNWVTLAEASFLYAHLSKAEKELFDRIERKLFRLSAKTNGETLFETYRFEIGPCPLLSREYSCRLHPYRPLSCRSVISLFPPLLCRRDILRRHGVKRIGAIIERRPSPYYHETPFAIDPILWRERFASRLSSAMIKTLSMTIEGALPTLTGLLNIIHGKQETSGQSAAQGLDRWFMERHKAALITINTGRSK